MEKIPEFKALETAVNEKNYHLLVGLTDNKWSIEVGHDKFRYEVADQVNLKIACEMMTMLLS